MDETRYARSLARCGVSMEKATMNCYNFCNCLSGFHLYENVLILEETVLKWLETVFHPGHKVFTLAEIFSSICKLFHTCKNLSGEIKSFLPALKPSYSPVQLTNAFPYADVNLRKTYKT